MYEDMEEKNMDMSGFKANLSQNISSHWTPTGGWVPCVFCIFKQDKKANTVLMMWKYLLNVSTIAV